MRACVLSRVRLFVTLWTGALQAPLSVGFSRQEYWRGLPFLSPGDLPDPGIEPVSSKSPALQADSLPLNHWGSPIFLAVQEGSRRKWGRQGAWGRSVPQALDKWSLPVSRPPSVSDIESGGIIPYPIRQTLSVITLQRNHKNEWEKCSENVFLNFTYIQPIQILIEVQKRKIVMINTFSWH